LGVPGFHFGDLAECPAELLHFQFVGRFAVPNCVVDELGRAKRQRQLAGNETACRVGDLCAEKRAEKPVPVWS
jgi:rRNA-processing protein FCF1